VTTDVARAAAMDVALTAATEVAPVSGADAAAASAGIAAAAAPTSRAQLRVRREADAERGAPQMRASRAVEREEQPPAAAVWPAPSSLSDPAGAREDAPADRGAGVIEQDGPPAGGLPPAGAAPVTSGLPESATDGAGASQAEALPDQIAVRRPAPIDDRLPMPIVYQPVSSSYVGEMRPPLPEARAADIPARASIVLIVLAAIGGVVVVEWLGAWDRTVAGLVSLVSVALAAGAFFLAIGGIVVATQRSRNRATSVVALAASLGLAVWLAFVAAQQALAILS